MADTNLIVKTPEMLNALTNKFVDLEGLKVFWANAKSYVDTQDAVLQEQIDDLKGAVSGGTFFRGVFESTDAVTDPKNGDVVVVKVKNAEGGVIGDKEYIYNGTTSEWVELGDVTAEQQRISTLEGAVADIKAEIGVDGNPDTATGLYQIIRQMEEGIRQDFSAADEAIMDGIGKFSTEDEDGTGLCLEIEERDAATLDAAKAYTDQAIEDVKGEIGIDGYYTKGEVDGLLTANSTTDQAYADGVAATAESNANTYTDEAIAAIQFTFASHEDIDGIFSVTHTEGE